MYGVLFTRSIYRAHKLHSELRDIVTPPMPHRLFDIHYTRLNRADEATSTGKGFVSAKRLSRKSLSLSITVLDAMTELPIRDARVSVSVSMAISPRSNATTRQQPPSLSAMPVGVSKLVSFSPFSASIPPTIVTPTTPMSQLASMLYSSSMFATNPRARIMRGRRIHSVKTNARGRAVLSIRKCLSKPSYERLERRIAERDAPFNVRLHYIIIVKARGYFPTNYIAFESTIESWVSSVTVRLVPKVKLKFRLMSDGRPVPEKSNIVIALLSGKQLFTSALHDGWVITDELPPLTPILVLVEDIGYKWLTQLPRRLRPGDVCNLGDFNLDHGAKLECVVFDPRTGMVAPNVPITLRWYDVLGMGQSFAIDTITNARGKCVIRGLPPGTYLLKVNEAGSILTSRLINVQAIISNFVLVPLRRSMGRVLIKGASTEQYGQRKIRTLTPMVAEALDFNLVYEYEHQELRGRWNVIPAIWSSQAGCVIKGSTMPQAVWTSPLIIVPSRYALGFYYSLSSDLYSPSTDVYGIRAIPRVEAHKKVGWQISNVQTERLAYVLFRAKWVKDKTLKGTHLSPWVQNTSSSSARTVIEVQPMFATPVYISSFYPFAVCDFPEPIKSPPGELQIQFTNVHGGEYSINASIERRIAVASWQIAINSRTPSSSRSSTAHRTFYTPNLKVRWMLVSHRAREFAHEQFARMSALKRALWLKHLTEEKCNFIHWRISMDTQLRGDIPNVHIRNIPPDKYALFGIINVTSPTYCYITKSGRRYYLPAGRWVVYVGDVRIYPNKITKIKCASLTDESVGLINLTLKMPGELKESHRLLNIAMEFKDPRTGEWLRWDEDVLHLQPHELKAMGKTTQEIMRIALRIFPPVLRSRLTARLIVWSDREADDYAQGMTTFSIPSSWSKPINVTIALRKKPIRCTIVGRVWLPGRRAPAAHVRIVPFLLNNPTPSRALFVSYDGHRLAMLLEKRTISGTDGSFVIPNLPDGIYGLLLLPCTVHGAVYSSQLVNTAPTIKWHWQMSKRTVNSTEHVYIADVELERGSVVYGIVEERTCRIAIPHALIWLKHQRSMPFGNQSETELIYRIMATILENADRFDDGERIYHERLCRMPVRGWFARSYGDGRVFIPCLRIGAYKLIARAAGYRTTIIHELLPLETIPQFPATFIPLERK